MKRALAIISLAIISVAAFCAGAEPDKKPESPQGTTNLFSNWMVASSNLTVKTPRWPWSGSKTVFLGSVRTKGRLKPVRTDAPIKPEVLEAMAQLQRRAEEQRERERLERVLKGPLLSEQYHVHLSPTPDQSTNSPAK